MKTDKKAESNLNKIIKEVGGQVSLSLDGTRENGAAEVAVVTQLSADRPPVPVIRADSEELAAHQRYLQAMAEKNGGICIWERYETDGDGAAL